MSNFLVRISTVVLLLVTLFTLSFFFFLVLGESFKKEKKMLLVRSFHFLFSPLGWKGGAALFAFLSDFDLHLSLSCYISSSESSNWVERSSELQALEESFSEEVAQPNPVGPAEVQGPALQPQEALPQAAAPAEVPNPGPDPEGIAALYKKLRNLVSEQFRHFCERGRKRWQLSDPTRNHKTF